MSASRRAVFLDAGHTLVEPTESVGDAYYRWARDVGARPDRLTFLNHLRASWDVLEQTERSRERLVTSEGEERAMWARFTRRVAAPFPDLLERHERWLERLFTWFDGAEAWRPVAGAHRVLEELRARGCVVGIVSNWHAALHDILRGLDLSALVDFVLVSGEFGHRKPSPRVFEEVLRRAQVTAKEATHVGDSMVDDVEGALRVGIRPVLMARGDVGHLPEDLDVIHELPALLDLL